MNVTRNVIRDLLPTYLGGEASEDTRRLVAEFFLQDPEFERLVRDQAQSLESFENAGAPPADAVSEKHALNRVRGILRWQRLLFGMALTFTLNAILIGFSFEITVTNKGQITHVHWMQFAFQRHVGIFLCAAALLTWIVYFARARLPRA